MKTFVIGHKRPDTDSIMSSIAYAYLKNELGDNCEARSLGDINKETKFALNYFNLKKPKYLNDVKLQLKDINYHKGVFVSNLESIYQSYKMMISSGLTGLPIVNNDNTITGLITMKDLSQSIINEVNDKLVTSYDNLLDVLQAKELLRFDSEIIGDIIVAAYKSSSIIDNFDFNENNILIVGDRHSVIEYAIRKKVKLIILTGDAYIKDEHLTLAKENQISVIKTQFNTFHTARMITLSNYVSTLNYCNSPIKFKENDFVDKVTDINNKLKHTNYPIVNKKNKCLGLLKITDLNEKIRKKVILVDHNEILQSVEGLEEAEIREIIDHHALSGIQTKQPINYRNMTVGSTCTIVYNLFLEKKINIPSDIAGALISGIISDTLILKSPTTTEKDREAVKNLALIAGIDYNTYGLDLLKSGTSLDGMSPRDVLFNDYKIFSLDDKKFAIGQFFTMNFIDIEKDIKNYIKTLDDVALENSYSLVCLYVTDIIKNGSYIIYNRSGKDYIDSAYITDTYQGMFIPNCLSRKKDIVPLIMSTIDN